MTRSRECRICGSGRESDDDLSLTELGRSRDDLHTKCLLGKMIIAFLHSKYPEERKADE